MSDDVKINIEADFTGDLINKLKEIAEAAKQAKEAIGGLGDTAKKPINTSSRKPVKSGVVTDPNQKFEKVLYKDEKEEVKRKPIRQIIKESREKGYADTAAKTPGMTVYEARMQEEGERAFKSDEARARVKDKEDLDKQSETARKNEQKRHTIRLRNFYTSAFTPVLDELEKQEKEQKKAERERIKEEKNAERERIKEEKKAKKKEGDYIRDRALNFSKNYTKEDKDKQAAKIKEQENAEKERIKTAAKSKVDAAKAEADKEKKSENQWWKFNNNYLDRTKRDEFEKVKKEFESQYGDYEKAPPGKGGPGGGGGKLSLGKRGLIGMLGGYKSRLGGLFVRGSVYGVGAQLTGMAMSGYAHMSNVSQNQSLTATGSVNQMAEMVPIVGSLVKGFTDLKYSLSGFDEKIRQSSESLEKTLTRLPIFEQQFTRQNEVEFEKQGLASRAESLKNNRADYGALPEPGNPYALQRFQERSPIARSMAQAKAGKEAAQKDFEAAQIKLDQARKNKEYQQVKINEHKYQLAKEIKGLSTSINPFTNEKKQIAIPLNNMFGAYKTQEVYTKLEQQALEEQKKAQQKLAVADSDIRKSEIQFKKYELSDINHQEGRLRGINQSFGAMSSGERMVAMNAARKFAKFGFNSLAQSEKGLLRSIDPELAREQEEASGSKQGEELRQLLNPYRKNALDKSLEEVQKRQIELNQEVNVAIELDTQKLAEDIKEKVGGILDEIKKVIVEAAEIQKKEAQVNENMKFGANSGA